MTIQFQHVWASNLVISLASEDDRTLSWIPVPRPFQAKHLSCQANLEITTPLIQGPFPYPIVSMYGIYTIAYLHLADFYGINVGI